MPVIWEEAFTLSVTASHSGSGTDIQYDEDTFGASYVWVVYTVEYSSHVEGPTGYYSGTDWWLYNTDNGKKLQANAAGNSTITVTLTFYGARLSDEELFGFQTPILKRRVT